MKRIIYFFGLFILAQMEISAQETLDANNPNSFIFGGDQKETSMQIELSPVYLVDIEPDPGPPATFGSSAEEMEAGLPPMGGIGSNTNEDLWLNFTHRAKKKSSAKITVSTNQALPIGVTLKVEIINSANTGDYFGIPVLGPITLSQAEQRIVDKIGGGYTGDGLNAGYQLKYTLDNPNGISLPVGFEVQYTIK